MRLAKDAPPQGLYPGQTAKFFPPLAVWPSGGSPRWQGACAAGGGHTARTAKGHGAPPVLAVWPPGAGRSPVGGAGLAPQGAACPPMVVGPDSCPIQGPVVPSGCHTQIRAGRATRAVEQQLVCSCTRSCPGPKRAAQFRKWCARPETTAS